MQEAAIPVPRAASPGGTAAAAFAIVGFCGLALATETRDTYVHVHPGECLSMAGTYNYLRFRSSCLMVLGRLWLVSGPSPAVDSA